MTEIREIFKKAEQMQIETEKARLRRAAKELERRQKAFEDAEEFGRIHMIATDRIFPNANQPRRKFEEDSIIRLADSIRRCGILQPLSVRRIEGAGVSDALFEIVAGERRFRAAKLLGLSAVPCIIISADCKRSAELAIIENIQREELNMFEEACAIASLIDMYALTQEDVAKQLSVSQSYVANKLRILRLTLPEREKILSYGFTERHARALLKLASASDRLCAIEYIHRHNLNVSAAESYIDRCVSESKAENIRHAPRKIILKDMRVFYNSIDRAISLVKQAGINVTSERVDAGDSTELTIRIPKAENVSRETFSEAEE